MAVGLVVRHDDAIDPFDAARTDRSRNENSQRITVIAAQRFVVHFESDQHVLAQRLLQRNRRAVTTERKVEEVFSSKLEIYRSDVSQSKPKN